MRIAILASLLITAGLASACTYVERRPEPAPVVVQPAPAPAPAVVTPPATIVR